MLCFHLLTFVTFRVIRAPHAGANAQLRLLLENFKSKNGHNYVKKFWGLSALLWEFQVNIFSSDRDIRKYQSSCMTMIQTTPTTMTGLWQYLNIFFKNSRAENRFWISRNNRAWNFCPAFCWVFVFKIMAQGNYLRSAIFAKGNNFCDFLFASKSDIALPNWCLLLKTKICFKRSKFLPFRVNPSCPGGQICKCQGYFPWKCTPTH